MIENAVIVGAGWLGQALGQHLIDAGLSVQMTTREPLRSSQHYWTLFNCEGNTIEHRITLQQAVWIFCIPAGRTPEKQASYRHYLARAIQLATQLNMQAFVLCSTTGVYPTEAGLYHESDHITATSERQSRLLQNEALTTALGNKGKVLRLAGLYGPKRHPGRFFEHKRPSSNGAETVNMIHQTEAVRAIGYIIEHIDKIPPIINLVMPDHPTKAAFYQQAAQKLNLPAPEFTSGKAHQRIISSQLLTDLGYQFAFNQLLDGL
ncbi:hypothetical protein [Neptunicella sp.]|uniref:hypothetical protein n=1 Tax=Neptunicella sp. TaxID=2125986 RepID=UPI003F693266